MTNLSKRDEPLEISQTGHPKNSKITKNNHYRGLLWAPLI
jgi:hypothetical protein